jgi:signal transduction histidine kinase
MSLKYKVSLLISLLFVVSGVGSLAVNRLLIMPSFHQLEREQAQRNVERAIEALHSDLEVLSTNVTAWAWWDESKRFMEGKNAGFVAQELSEEPVASAEVSYMGFYRTTGKQVIHRAPAAEEAGSPGLGELEQASLPADHPLLHHADIRGDAKGLVRTPLGPMLVASRPILTSSGEGPAAGVLIFGRLLNAAAIERIARQYKLDLSVAPAAPTSEPIVWSSTDWQPGQPRRSEVQLEPKGSVLTGETTLADIHGQPILTLEVTTQRAISARGEEASRIALATLCAVALAVLGLLLGLLHVTVLGPIVRLTEHAVDVGNNDALHKRLRLERDDELGVLAAEFDRMTDHLVEARQRLIDQSFVSGKADMAAGILHNLGNAVTPISVRLNTLSDRIKGAPLADVESAVGELESGAAPERREDLTRFVELAARELVEMLRDALTDVHSIGTQVAHVQQILTEQERYSRAGWVLEGVEMEPVVRLAADGLSPELQWVVTVTIDSSVREIGTVRGTHVEIQQVVGNLILNAAESIRSQRVTGGSIVVRAARETTEGKAMAHLVFEDNGAGIEPLHLQQIFERRFSTKQRGSGLGLHWSANAVAALGGRLFAESPGRGKGATLHLILPLVLNSPEAARTVAAAAEVRS